MSYEAIADKIAEINGGIQGIVKAYKYEPISIQPPCIYQLLQASTVAYQPQRFIAEYTFILRLLVRYTDAETCEATVAKLIDRIVACYQKAVKLNGALVDGHAHITGVRASYLVISKIVYRCIEFTLQVREATVVEFEV